MQPVSIFCYRHGFVRFALPLLLAVGLPVGLHQATPFIESYEWLVQSLPYILLPIVALLGQLFNQSRLSIAAIIMLASYYIVQTWLQSPLSVTSVENNFILLALLLPLNLLMVHRLPEKRLISGPYLSFILFALGLFLFISYIFNTVIELRITTLWPQAFIHFPLISPLPVGLILFFIGATTLHSTLLLKRNLPHDQALFICTLFSAISFIYFTVPQISSISFSIASILLLINLISCSHELAYIDQLTGIPSRRSLDTELKNLGRTYTIAMLDIDHFKVFNDAYGHKTGDDVLRFVASVLAKQQNGAKVYRYGGEEFTIIFKGRTQETCLRALERLRKQIESYPLALQEHGQKDSADNPEAATTNITVSIGVSDNKNMPDPHAVLRAADKALYRAKSSGRNRVCQRLQFSAQ